jgi:outer membrane protein assembly factor BamB
MNARFMRVNVRARFMRWAVAWCVGAAVFGSQVAVRADEAGMAVLKSARWRIAALPGWSGLYARAVVPGGGPIIGMGSGGITAWDRASGKQIWSNQAESTFFLGVGEKTVLVHKRASNPGERKLYALSAADGSVVYDIPVAREYAHVLPEGVRIMGKTVIFVSYTLTVDPNSVAMPPIGRVSVPGPRVVTAYDVVTGKELWKNNSPENKNVFCWFDPLLEIRTGAEQQMIDSATGKTVWSVPLNGREHDASFLVPGQVRSGDGTWYFLERGGAGDAVNGFQLIARDGATGKLLRQHKIPYSPGALGTVAGGLVILREPRKPSQISYMDSSWPAVLTEDEKKDKLTAIDMQSGKIAWAAAVPTDSPTIHIRVADDLLLVGEPDIYLTFQSHGKWNMTVLEAATGKTLWSKALRTDVVMHKDIMIFAVADQIVGANRRDGKILWSIPSNTAGDAACEPLVADGTLYLSIYDSGGGASSGLYAIPLENNPALAGARP